MKKVILAAVVAAIIGYLIGGYSIVSRGGYLDEEAGCFVVEWMGNEWGL